MPASSHGVVYLVAGCFGIPLNSMFGRMLYRLPDASTHESTWTLHGLGLYTCPVLHSLRISWRWGLIPTSQSKTEAQDWFGRTVLRFECVSQVHVPTPEQYFWGARKSDVILQAQPLNGGTLLS